MDIDEVWCAMDPVAAVGLGGIVVVAHSSTIDDPEEPK